MHKEMLVKYENWKKFHTPAKRMTIHAATVMDLSALPRLPSAVVPAGFTSGSGSQSTIIATMGMMNR